MQCECKRDEKWRYIMLTIGRRKRRERRRRRKTYWLMQISIPVTSPFLLNFFLLPRLCQSSILARCRITRPSLINPPGKKSFLKRSRCSAAERFVVPADTAISPHIYGLLWPWELREKPPLDDIYLPRKETHRRSRSRDSRAAALRRAASALSHPLAPAKRKTAMRIANRPRFAPCPLIIFAPGSIR